MPPLPNLNLTGGPTTSEAFGGGGAVTGDFTRPPRSYVQIVQAVAPLLVIGAAVWFLRKR